MSINKYEKDGKTFWRVSVSVRSKSEPKFRRQRSLFGLPNAETAIAEEKRLYRELTEEVMTAETKGKI
ncbi:MAG: hypothetical protein IT285_03410 [Bdellovibrionales bacterium]|nr:hypothetical protein [Bdellovibrionales bacterium]